MSTLALSILLTSILLAGFPGGGLAADQGEPREEGATVPVAVHVEGGLVSVDVRDEPLADVLRAIAQQAGVELEVHSGGDDRVTDSFDDVRVGESIQRLARGHDVILVFGAASDGTARRRLVAAHVYEASAPATVPADPKQRAAHLREVRQLIRQARQNQPGAVNSLIALLSSDPDPTIRRTAAAALGSIGGPEAVAALTTALNDQEASVRVSALTALGRRHEESAVPSLAQVAARDSEASVRRAAVWALSSLRSDEAHQAIEGATSDPDSTVRRAAQSASRIWRMRNARAK